MTRNYHTVRHWWRFAWAQHLEHESNTMIASWGIYRRIVGNLWWFTPEKHPAQPNNGE